MKIIKALSVLCALPCCSSGLNNKPWQQFARNPSISLSQSKVLYDFFLLTKNETSTPLSWFDASSNVTNYCQFEGVKCNKNDFVVGIDVRGFGLRGQLSKHIEVLTSNLTELKKLVLSKNAFHGEVPDSICRFRTLQKLDLSLNTRLTGRLPVCMSTMTNLTSLRIMNVGLVGEVPHGLCAPRPMNNLPNNTFGCDAVACRAGTYRKATGRQMSNQTACIPCDVPSNVLGSTSCHWVLDAGGRKAPINTHTPSVSPSLGPTRNPTPQPSSYISPSPSATKTFLPSARPLGTLRPISQPPSLNPISRAPSEAPNNGRNGVPVDGIVADQQLEGDSSLTHKEQVGVIGGTISVLALAAVTSLLVWKQKKRNRTEEEPQIFDVSSAGSFDETILPQEKSLSTIDEEDKTSSNSASSPPPPRKVVRFTLPAELPPWSLSPPISLRQEGSGDAMDTVNDSKQPPKVDAWASWIMDSSSSFCSSDNNPQDELVVSPLEDDDHSNSTTSQTPLFEKKESIASDYFHPDITHNWSSDGMIEI